MDSVLKTRVRLAVLDTYGVRWDRFTFARDILQNFFDATPSFRAVEVDIDRETRVIQVSGPISFDLELLAYIGGTTKHDGRTAGGFGEGFKICALVAVRDFGLVMRAGSGSQELEVLLDPVPLGRELCYDVTPRLGGVGSFVRLEGADDALMNAFETARLGFRFVGNPRLVVPLISTENGEVAVYRGFEIDRGEIYYRRQLRGSIEYYKFGRPGLTLVHDPPIEALEGDRDRRDVSPVIVAEAVARALSEEQLFRVFLELEMNWGFGGEVLGALIRVACARKLKFTGWPARWLATGPRDDGKNEMASNRGFFLAIRDFAKIGMRTPQDVFTNDLETRDPTTLENDKLMVLAQLYASLNGRPSATQRFQVFDDVARSAVKGQHLGEAVLVGSHLIAEGFDAVAGTALHEFAHEAGGESAPSFHRRLRRLLEGVIRNPDCVDEARARYHEIRPGCESVAAANKAVARKRYSSLADYTSKREAGIPVQIFAPPSFPPLLEIGKRLSEVATLLGLQIQVSVISVLGQTDAVRLRAPGVPTVRIDGQDVSKTELGYGYRLRTYSDGSLSPSLLELEAALTRAHQNRTPEPPDPEHTDNADAIESAIGGYGILKSLEDVWPHCLKGLGNRLARAVVADPRSTEVLVTEAKERRQSAVELARALRRSDPDFDDADDFESHAMAAAQGCAVLAYFEGEDAARRAFSAVREITRLTLELPVATYLKVLVIFGTLMNGGIAPYGAPERFDPEIALGAFLGFAKQARYVQRVFDEEGRKFRRPPIKEISPTLGMGYLISSSSDLEDWDVEASWKVKAEYDKTLADTQDPIVAAERALAAAVREYGVES